MKLRLDADLFEQHQRALVQELVQNIRVKLQEAGLPADQLDDVTASIAFSVTSSIDDTSAIECDGIEVHPFLTFRTGDDELTYCGENAYTHEFVYEVMQALAQPK
jgi:hypothetical protein